MADDTKLTTDASDEEVIEPEDKKEETTEETVEEKSPYEEELARIEAEKAAAKAEAETAQAELEKERQDKKRLMDLKDKAIKDEKSKTADISEKLKTEILTDWERRMDLRDAKAKVADITTDPTAQKVVMHYFETLPDALRTGSVEDQLLTAFALANKKRLPDLITAQSSEDMEERRSLSSMGGNDGGRSSFKTSPSAKAQVASRLSRAFAGNDKDLAKRLADRAQNRLR